MRTACFTSFALSYLPRARVMALSLARAHPDWERWALLVDRAPPGHEADFADFHHVVPVESLSIPRRRHWLFKHDLIEACTAAKGRMLEHLLELGVERVVYLDPDIVVFAPLASVLAEMARASLVLTPHQTAPATSPQAAIDNERGSMTTGIFNLGFLAVRNDAQGRAFAAWWAARLHEACYDDRPAGLFTDQKYVDLAPALFGGVSILRDPGCNVASWNLDHRPLEFTQEGVLTAAGAPVSFFHFTKVGGAGDAMIERYAGENPVPFELLAWYRRALAAAAVPALDGLPWAYGHFTDFTPIPHAARLAWRAHPELWGRFDDPFAAGPGSFAAWLMEPR